MFVVVSYYTFNVSKFLNSHTWPCTPENNILKFKKIYILLIFHVKLILLQSGKARPQFADGEEGLQILRVTANILYKQ
jgi:hypothetical protein